ncbi:MAG: hypothetical protein ACOX8Q_02780 [Christensenellales bacterium]|jgi:hypothetical protein
MKKILAITVVIALALTLVPTAAFAAATTVTTAAELTSALDAGGEIILGADIDAGEIDSGSFFSVANGKTVIFELNGHTLQGTRTGTATADLISNSGTLTIQDSVGGGQLIMDSTQDSGWASRCAVVSNSGTLTINSGIILNNGITSMSYAVDNLSNGSGIYAHLYVNGGTIRSENYIGLRLFANSDSDDFCTATIAGGTIYGYKRGIWVQQPSLTKDGEAVLDISGGRVEAQEQSAVMVDLLRNDGVDILISGGELVNSSDTYATLALMLDTNPSAGGGNVVIIGGQFLNTGVGGNLSVQDTTTEIAVSAGMFSAVVPSEFIATDANPDDIIQPGSVITADVDVIYTIVITPSVDFGTIDRSMSTQTKDFLVAVEDAQVEDDATITVTNTTTDMSMKDKDGAGSESLDFALAQAGGVFTFPQDELTDGEALIESSVSCEPSELEAAGSYKGYMTFEVSYNSMD